MGFSYLGKNKKGEFSSWSEVTRDERTFCMYLFKAFENCPEKLLTTIQVSNPLEKYGWLNEMQTEGSEWELAYEVCFYRDLLYANGIGLKAASDRLLSPEFNIPSPEKLIKRTFDLCLFSQKEIIIIEAKSAEGIGKDQFNDFEMDEEYITKLISGLYPNRKKNEIPKVKTVVLASSYYYDSPSFSLTKGIGKQFILDKNGENKKVHGVISWSHLVEYMIQNSIGTLNDREMMVRANESYKR